jgi:hypothetical protein
MPTIFNKENFDKDDILDYCYFIRNSKRPEWRLGQTIYNLCSIWYPTETRDLAGTKEDCFYNNENIDKFLLALEISIISNS